MTDTNAEKRPFARLLQPLPAIEDKHPLPIEADVDSLLAAVMEKAGVTKAHYEEKVGQFKRTDEPTRFLGRKTEFLVALLLGKEQETRKQTWEEWDETWKDLLHTWLTPLMRVAVYEPDPSFNRWLIEPALRACGSRRVLEVLFAYLEQGTNREKAGAARAFYWAWGLRGQSASEGMSDDEWKDLGRRANLLLLGTFVECEDLDVRRSIIPLLELMLFSHPEECPEEGRHLIPKAMHLARTHPDEYIRQRIDMQGGGSGNPSERDTLLNQPVEPPLAVPEQRASARNIFQAAVRRVSRTLAGRAKGKRIGF